MSAPYGLIRAESNADYHANDAVSTSKLKTFMESAYAYFRQYVCKDCKREETDAMRFGSMFHEYVLKPELFTSHYVELPDGVKANTNAGKETIAELTKTGRIPIKKDEFDKLFALRQSVFSNPTAAALLKDGEAELSWRIKTGAGYDMQCRTDWFVEAATAEQVEELQRYGIMISEGQPFIVDLKTTSDLPSWFHSNYGNAVYKFGYHLQCAFYRAVVNMIRKQAGKEIIRHFLFVVVEKAAPNDCAVVALNEASFGLAETQLKHWLRKLGDCYASGVWPGYKDRGVIVTGVPERIASTETQEIFEQQAHVHCKAVAA